MATSRRVLVRTVVDQLENEKTAEVMKRLAAYIIENKLSKQIEIILADIEAELTRRKVVIADVATARPLVEASREAILDYIRGLTNTQNPELRETIDESLLGGAIIKVAGTELDSSLKTKLQRLKTI
jgi:F-type H+-transporting ATPase subunit delta